MKVRKFEMNNVVTVYNFVQTNQQFVYNETPYCFFIAYT